MVSEHMRHGEAHECDLLVKTLPLKTGVSASKRFGKNQDNKRSVSVDCGNKSEGTSVARTSRFEIAGSFRAAQCFSRAVVNPEHRREACAIEDGFRRSDEYALQKNADLYRQLV